jgi:hypothetical protein
MLVGVRGLCEIHEVHSTGGQGLRKEVVEPASSLLSPAGRQRERDQQRQRKLLSIQRHGKMRATDSLIHAPRPAMSCNSWSVRAQTGRFRAEPMKPAGDMDEDTPARGTW